MSSSPTRTTLARTPTQTLVSVTRAEAFKLLAPGGIRVWAIIAVILGVVSGVGAVLLSGVQSLQEVATISFSDVLTSGPMMVALVLGLSASNYVPREISDGTVITSKYLVPRSGMLFAARMLSWGLVTVAIGMVTALVSLVAVFASPNVRQSIKVESFAALILALVLSACVVLLAHAGATLLRRGALIVAVGMTVLFVLPLVIGLAALTTSGLAATILTWLSRVVLGTVLFNALQIPTGTNASWVTWSWSAVGVIVWLVVTAGLAYHSFRKSGYGDT